MRAYGVCCVSVHDQQKGGSVSVRHVALDLAVWGCLDKSWLYLQDTRTYKQKYICVYFSDNSCCI